MGSLQFIGRPAVIKAFENRNILLWSLWQNKQFLFKGEGGEDLNTVLVSLEDNGAASVYTLKVYEGVEDLAKIKSNTQDDGSFNFRLADNDAGGGVGSIGARSINEKILETLGSFNKRLEDLEETETTEPGGGLGKLGLILESPAIQQVLPGILERVLGLILPPVVMEPGQKAPAQLAGVNDDLVLMEVVQSLKKHDPLILGHLQKLLLIAETNQPLFQALITNL